VDDAGDTIQPLVFSAMPSFVTVVETAGPQFTLTLFKDQVVEADVGLYTLDITLADDAVAGTRVV